MDPEEGLGQPPLPRIFYVYKLYSREWKLAMKYAENGLKFKFFREGGDFQFCSGGGEVKPNLVHVWLRPDYVHCINYTVYSNI